MPRITKFEDTIYEKTEFSGKILMYSSVSWNVLFPIVDIFRLLKNKELGAELFEKRKELVSLFNKF